MKSEREDIPIVSVSSKSAVNSYRMVWCVWIGLSLVYTAVYCHLAVLNGRLLQGCVLASAFLIQALLVPAYVWREKFSSGAGAVIQAACAAVSIVGIPATFLALTESSLRPSGLNPHYFDFAYTNTYGLQFGYVTTILVLSGVAGGTALGILRWRILQARRWKRTLRRTLKIPAPGGIGISGQRSLVQRPRRFARCLSKLSFGRRDPPQVCGFRTQTPCRRKFSSESVAFYS